MEGSSQKFSGPVGSHRALWIWRAPYRGRWAGVRFRNTLSHFYGKSDFCFLLCIRLVRSAPQILMRCHFLTKWHTLPHPPDVYRVPPGRRSSPCRADQARSAGIRKGCRFVVAFHPAGQDVALSTVLPPGVACVMLSVRWRMGVCCCPRRRPVPLPQATLGPTGLGAQRLNPTGGHSPGDP